MPELPEVQTVVNDLNEKIVGDTIVSFWSEWPAAIKNKSLKIFQKEIIGRRILGVRRIGKNIFIDLSGEKTLYLHLKMTGHLLIKPARLTPLSRRARRDISPEYRGERDDFFDDRVNQYIRHSWTLKDGKNKIKQLDFSDVRKFAKIVLDDTAEIAKLKEIIALGVDALDKNFTYKKFQEILSRKAKSQIGIILMDQNLIAGIGNIYRSEILFEAGILPERKVESLNDKEMREVYSHIKKILQKAVKLRGTSDSDYRDTSGAPGGFQKVLKVYRKEKQKCQKCGTIIIRKTLGQRSVFLCPKCQK